MEMIYTCEIGISSKLKTWWWFLRLCCICVLDSPRLQSPLWVRNSIQTTGKVANLLQSKDHPTGRNADFHTLAEALVVVCQEPKGWWTITGITRYGFRNCIVISCHIAYCKLSMWGWRECMTTQLENARVQWIWKVFRPLHFFHTLLCSETSCLVFCSYMHYELLDIIQMGKTSWSLFSFLTEWDSDMASILLLLHLLSPQPAGRKKTQKISVAQAIDHLVVFHKVCGRFKNIRSSHQNYYRELSLW